jgi:pimeloyl-ACP methyl ester carboxylesterase
MGKKEIIYCIPGLGLDYRLFGKLSIEGVELKFLDYIEPLKNENITSYAKRLAEEITDEEFSLLGMSLGGMLAIEIAETRKVNRLFLISTVKNKSEIPLFFKYIDKLPTSNKTASKLAIDATVAFKPYYDKSDDAGNKLFDAMIHSASTALLAWGVREIANWNFEKQPNCSFYHLHGTADMIFPVKNIDQAETLKGATHYMVYNDAVEVSKRIGARIKLLAPSI